MRNKHIAKVVTALVLLTGMIFAFGIYSARTFSSSAAKIENHIEKIETAARTADWKKAETDLSTAKTQWEKTSTLWTVLLDHIEIDSIDTSFAKVEKYVSTKDLPLALAESATLRQLIRHIPEKESVKWRNIF